MVAKTVATFGPIDILVNNAAVFDFKALADIDEAHFHHIFDTNVLGLLMTTKVAVANFNSARRKRDQHQLPICSGECTRQRRLCVVQGSGECDHQGAGARTR